MAVLFPDDYKKDKIKKWHHAFASIFGALS